MFSKRLLGVFVFVCLAICSLTPAVAKEAYVIGCSMAVTGPGSDTYAQIKQAMDIYFDDVNARGGINGHPVEIIVEDNAGQPSKAAAHAKKFVTQAKVIMVMLASLSSTYAPVVKVTTQYGVPLFYGGAVCPDACYPPKADPNQFCSTAFGAKFDSQFAIPFIHEQAKGRLKLGLVAMNIPISRGEIDYAEGLAKERGIEVVDKEATPPPTPDYTPYATKIKDAGADWVYTWAPWGCQIRTFEALRKIGWKGNYLAYGHIQAEDELKRLKDDGLYVFGTNAFFADNTEIHRDIIAASEKARSVYPYTQLMEGWIAAMVCEEILRNTPWPPTPEKVRTAMNNVHVDTKGLKGGPLIWTENNHFRRVTYYRAYKWDSSKGGIVIVRDWTPVEVK
jgi:branched-chain amino acid transport system substrate-binding protein